MPRKYTLPPGIRFLTPEELAARRAPKPKPARAPAKGAAADPDAWLFGDTKPAKRGPGIRARAGRALRKATKLRPPRGIFRPPAGWSR